MKQIEELFAKLSSQIHFKKIEFVHFQNLKNNILNIQ